MVEKPKPLPREIFPPKLSRIFARGIWRVMDSYIDLDYPQKDRTNLKLLDQHLANHSIIAVGHHPGQFEALAAPILLATLDNLNHGLGPIAAYQYHRLLPQMWAMLASASLRMHLLPVVRSQDGNIVSDDQPYAHLQTDYNDRLKYHTHRLLEKPGNLYGVIASGTRSRTLPKAIIPSFAKIMNPGEIGFIPMAIWHAGDKSVKVRIGQILDLNHAPWVEGTRDQLTAVHAVWILEHLARILPPEMRGPYDS